MITGIIAEYNPFHNGHKYQIDEIKKHSDSVVAVMSGSFVQRGDAAVYDKWTRAKAAVFGGADLVLELPVCYALNAAPNFAAGGIGILNALGIIDRVAFGSECGDIQAITNAAYLIENENTETSERIKLLVNSGISYPSALTRAYEDKIPKELLSEPNNILAIEYIRALIRQNSNIEPITIKRHASSHHDSDIHSGFASASKIREMLLNGEDAGALIPDCGIDFRAPRSVSKLDTAIISFLRSIPAAALKNISEMTEGLENRIIQAAMRSDSFASLCSQIKNKRYTMSKIRRIVLAAFLGFRADIYKPQPDYIRVLALNSNGMSILKQSKQKCKIPIITKAADYKGESAQFALDIRATDIAALCGETECEGGADFTTSPVIIKN